MSASPVDWTPFRLDDLGFVGRGRSRHRPRDDESLYGGVYPFFQTGDIKAATLYLTEYSQTYNEKGLAQSRLWQPGTVCITIAANIAETAILGIPGCFPDSVVGFVPDARTRGRSIRQVLYRSNQAPHAEGVARHYAGQSQPRQVAAFDLGSTATQNAGGHRRRSFRLR